MKKGTSAIHGANVCMNKARKNYISVQGFPTVPSLFFLPTLAHCIGIFCKTLLSHHIYEAASAFLFSFCQQSAFFFIFTMASKFDSSLELSTFDQAILRIEVSIFNQHSSAVVMFT
jgi:hypothetical protein